MYKTKASCFCRQFLFRVTGGVLSSRYFFLWACQSDFAILCGMFLISLSLHTKLFYYWVDPPPLNKIFEKFGSGNREGNRQSMIREFIRKFVVWEIFELAWGVPESEISHFLVFQLFSSFSHHLYFVIFKYFFNFQWVNTGLSGTSSCAPERWQNFMGSWGSFECHSLQETTTFKCLSLRCSWQFWRSLPVMM